MSSPTVRSLALLRSTGWTVQVVEHWNALLGDITKKRSNMLASAFLVPKNLKWVEQIFPLKRLLYWPMYFLSLEKRKSHLK